MSWSSFTIVVFLCQVAAVLKVIAMAFSSSDGLLVSGHH
jgi:hypothetical protein